MSEGVLAAIIAGVLSLAGTIITVIAANKNTIDALDKRSALSDAKLDAKVEKAMAVTDTKIEELTRRVEQHNNIIERTYRLEGEMQEVQHDIRDIKNSSKGERS